MPRLKRARIENFRSIRDSGWVDFGAEISALIGENESGKTNFLKALRSFNPMYSYSHPDLCQYEFFHLRQKDDSEIPIITIEYGETILDQISMPVDLNVSNNESKYLELTITKYYDGHYEANGEIFREKNSNITLENHILEDRARSSIRSSISDIRSQIKDLEENKQFETEKENRLDVTDYNRYKQDLSASKFTSIEEYIELLDDFSYTVNDLRTSANNNSATNALSGLRNTLNEQKEDISKKIDGLKPGPVLQSVPDFVFHDSVNNIEDSLTITELKEKPESHRTFHNLLSLTPIKLDELKLMPEGRRTSYTNSASQSITRQVDGAWRQETIDDIRVSVDGDSLSVMIEDDSGTTGHPSSRSQGFQWFFSFYINFTSETDQDLKDSILLLDDPGVYLHPSGQKDLLEKFEQLANDNQVIYNTHSPFLIDKGRLERIKILNKDGDQGTQITSDLHTSDGDILQPIRAAFGAEFADSLFANKKTILVEGYTDKIYLDSVSKYLRRTNRKGQSFDPDEVTVISVGGANKFDYFAKLLSAESYDYLVLLDADNEGRDVKRRLNREVGIEEDRVLMLDDIISDLSSYDATVEDLFEPDFFCGILTETHNQLSSTDDLDLISRGNVDAAQQEYGRKIGGVDKTGIAKRIRDTLNEPECEDAEIGEVTVERFTTMFKAIQDTL